MLARYRVITSDKRPNTRVTHRIHYTTSVANFIARIASHEPAVIQETQDGNRVNNGEDYRMLYRGVSHK
jgi:hypothetical protein